MSKVGVVFDKSINERVFCFFNSLRNNNEVNLTYTVNGSQLTLISNVISSDINGSVEFYVDGVSKGSVDWTGGDVSKTVTVVGGNHSVYCVYTGSSTVTSSTLNVSVKYSSTLSITVPTSIIYSDAFNITGVLSDSSNNLLNGKTVNLLVGDTVVDSTITGDDGGYSFTRTPVSMGTHSFTVEFDGDNVYEQSSSNTVNRTVGKETTVLSFNTVGSYSRGDLINLTGVLTTDDAEPIADAPISIKIGGNIYSTQTDSNGAYLYTCTATKTMGSVVVSYAGDDNYLSSSITSSVNVLEPSILTLSSDKDTVALNNHDSAVLTATLKDANNTPMVGETITIMIDDAMMDDIYTDESGVATYTYDAVGAGDVDIVASFAGLCRETCRIVDFLFRPLLDGTDEITSWTNMTNKTENGIFTSHGSFLTEGWSNEGLWQLDFDVQYTSTYYVGLMPLCSEEINPFTDAKVANYAYTMWECYNNGGGFGSSIASGGITRFTNTNVNHITIIKLSATQIKVIINETNEVISNVPNMANISTLHIGSRDNPSSRNTGGLVKYSNIEVKAL